LIINNFIPKIWEKRGLIMLFQRNFCKSILLKSLILSVCFSVIAIAGWTYTAQAATDCNAVTGIPVAECQQLLSLYNSAGGANWTNKTGWNQTNTPCSWKGVTCSGGHVQELRLDNNQLKGIIPDLNLPNLTTLGLDNNQLSGSLPDFSLLPNLQWLALDNNKLSGNLPSFNLTSNLAGLSIQGNMFSGCIPNFNLPNLMVLWLSKNQLSGSAPNLSTLPNLTSITLNNNCGLTAYDNNQKLVLDTKDPIWQQKNSNCTAVSICPASINGTVWNDLNADGIRQTGEPGLLLKGVKLTYTPVSHGPYDFYELTDSKGNYSCKDLTAGGYTVFIDTEPGWIQTYPPVKYTGNITSFQTITELNFGFSKINRLTITKAGNGTGTVTSTPAGVDCGLTCYKDYTSNIQATLNATASAGSFFAGWGGACSGTAPCQVSMSQAQNVTANFNILTRIINLSGTLAFGNVNAGSSKQLTMTIQNTGNSTLTVSSITYPAGFTGNWNSGTIMPGGSQDVTVTFTPTAVQNYSGNNITVNSDKTSGTNTIAISGEVTTKIIGLSGDLAFGDVQVNTTKQSSLTISNIGNTKLTVSSITYPAGFTGNWNSGTIMPGGSQIVTVTFTPTAIQSYSGEIKVNSDKTSGTDTSAISGTGTIVPTRIINLSGTLAFGSVKVGSTTTKTLTIRNTGNSTLTVNSITYPSAEFISNWNGTIEPGASQDVIVTFMPKAVKTYNSTVKVNSDKTSGTDTISTSATVIGDDNSFVIRTLPSCYSPGTKMTVTLTATPPSGTLNYIISDSPPDGWTVSNISSPGSYDNNNKKVKFIFIDGSAQTLTYDVLPPLSDTGDKSFAGNVLRASLSSAVTGMSDISQCQNTNNHPADIDADFRITEDEYIAYLTAWLNGDLWDGVTIEGSYASRAGGIWGNGETYKYDPTVGTPPGSPPMCWVNTSRRSVRDNGTSSVIRKMSAYYKADEAVTVYLEVTVTGGLFYTIEETPPDGWTVSDISGNGHFDKVNKVVKFYGNQTKTWSYKVTPPADTTGSKTFSGKSWFNGAAVAITGMSSVSDTALSVAAGDVNGSGDPDLADAILTLQVLSGLNPPNVNIGADVNGDNKIGLEEVIYILQKAAELR